MSHLSPTLFVVLNELVPELYVHCVEPWCVIGSSAALLLGAEVSASDVDVLVSGHDAATLAEQWADRREASDVPGDTTWFRAHVARFRFSGMPVDVIDGLERPTADGWQTVHAGKLVLAGVNGLAVPVPSLDDQIRLVESFGRDKDRVHAAALRALKSPSSLLSILSSS